MLSQLLPYIAIVALPVLANTISPRFCSLAPPSQAWRDSIQDVILDEKTGNFTAFAEDIVIDTYIHVVTSSKSPEDGYLSVSCRFDHVPLAATLIQHIFCRTAR